MNSLEQWISGITAAVCMVLLVRLCLGAARQRRFDHAVRTLGWKLRNGSLRLWRAPAARRVATREAQAAIDRARKGRGTSDADDGEWQGNVYTPKSFRKHRKPH